VTIKVLIVDDSSFYQKRLAHLITEDPRMTVAAVAANGKEALELIVRHQPDVITLDLEMPVMGGIEAMKRIKSITKAPVLMLSTWTTEGAKATLEALEAGATDFMAKRFEDLTSQSGNTSKLCEQIYSMVTQRHATHSYVAKKAVQATNPPTNSAPKKINLVAIGASTGGPVAVQQVLSHLPANYPYPILLIQHMPAAFTPTYAESLIYKCAIQIKEAEDGDPLKAGHAYLAPGGKQLTITGSRNNLQIKIKAADDSDMYKPCIDKTFASIAQAGPNSTLALILTGMGSDGCEGSRAIKAAGGTIWSQDEQSSTIYGMPRAISKAGLADRILSLTDIGQALVDVAQ
jgi:two-component system chemotaxis response regulator CheB